MTPETYEHLIRTIRREPLPLQKLHGFATDAGSTWSVEQLHLMLECMEGVEVYSEDNETLFVRLGRRTEQDELVDAIADVVRSQGRPVPAAQVLSLLPGKFTTSVEQIKRIAKETQGLKVMGPGLIAVDG